MIGICDEISALSRAGLPLEKSLSTHSCQNSGDRLVKLAQELETGSTLSEAMREDAGFPPFCAAVVDAGLESGNLSGILDTIALIARQLRDARLFVLQALLYPIILFTALWCGLIALCFFMAPVYPPFFDAIGVKSPIASVLVWVGANSLWIIPIIVVPPILMWTLYGLWYRYSNRFSLLNQTGIFRPIRFIPWFRKAMREMRQVVFARNLAILVDASVPLDRALELVKATSGNFEREQERLIHWAHGMKEEQLVNGLRLVADNAQLKATLKLTRCQMFLPGLAMLLVAVVLCAVYLFVVGWPILQIIYQLTSPFNG